MHNKLGYMVTSTQILILLFAWIHALSSNVSHIKGYYLYSFLCKIIYLYDMSAVWGYHWYILNVFTFIIENAYETWVSAWVASDWILPWISETMNNVIADGSCKIESNHLRGYKNMC